jgi:peptidoglycan LD-endopeptidase LytH
VGDSSFFALYGHLSHTSITHTQDAMIDAGEQFAKLGQRSENGNWFEHLHLQVFTGTDIEKWKNK